MKRTASVDISFIQEGLAIVPNGHECPQKLCLINRCRVPKVTKSRIEDGPLGQDICCSPDLDLYLYSGYPLDGNVPPCRVR